MSAPQSTWEALGDLLAVRRVELDARFKNLTLFCREREINWRLAWDIENGKRANYRRQTMLSVDAAYGLAARSVQHFVDLGAALTPVAGTPGSGTALRRPLAEPPFADAGLQEVWDESAGLPDARRRGLVELARRMREGSSGEGQRRRA